MEKQWPKKFSIRLTVNLNFYIGKAHSVKDYFAMQPHFDYGCTSWYALLSKVFKKSFRLIKISAYDIAQISPHALTSLPHTLEKLTGSVQKSEQNFVWQLVFKYSNQLTPSYFNVIIITPSFNKYNTRSPMALDIPLQKTVLGQKSTSFIGPKIGFKINNDLKTVLMTNFFTYTLKKEMLNNLIIQKNKTITIIILIITILFSVFITIIIIICYQFYPQEDPNGNKSLTLFQVILAISEPVAYTYKYQFYLFTLFIFSHFSKYCKVYILIF